MKQIVKSTTVLIKAKKKWQFFSPLYPAFLTSILRKQVRSSSFTCKHKALQRYLSTRPKYPPTVSAITIQISSGLYGVSILKALVSGANVLQSTDLLLSHSRHDSHHQILPLSKAILDLQQKR